MISGSEIFIKCNLFALRYLLHTALGSEICITHYIYHLVTRTNLISAPTQTKRFKFLGPALVGNFDHARERLLHLPPSTCTKIGAFGPNA